MRKHLYVGALFLTLLVAGTAFPQKQTCACKKEGRECGTTTTCSDGCTSLCGPGASCASSCTKLVYEQRYTETFVKKTGQEIAAELSTMTQQKIEFTPFRRTKGAQYDVEMKNDDIFNVLNYLSRRGTVRLNGTDFTKLKLLQNKKTNNKKQISGDSGTGVRSSGRKR